MEMHDHFHVMFLLLHFIFQPQETHVVIFALHVPIAGNTVKSRFYDTWIVSCQSLVE